MKRIGKIAGILALAMAGWFARGQDADDTDLLAARQRLGKLESACVSVPDVESTSSHEDFIWYRRFERPGARSLYFRLTVSRIGAGTWWMRFVRTNGTVVSEISSGDFSGPGRARWTARIDGSEVRLFLAGDARGTSFLADCTADDPRAKVESIIPPNDLKSISQFRKDQIYQWGKSVARLEILEIDGPYACTGLLVSPTLLLTNRHCFSGQWVSMLAVFQEEQDNIAPRPKAEVASVEASSWHPDFALLRLKAAPIADSFRIRVPLGKIGTGTRFVVIQHPNGGYKQVASERCNAEGVPVGAGFEHTCDTESGSSGSPMFSVGGGLLAIHQAGFNEKLQDGRNSGVPLAGILDFLQADKYESLRAELGL